MTVTAFHHLTCNVWGSDCVHEKNWYKTPAKWHFLQAPQLKESAPSTFSQLSKSRQRAPCPTTPLGPAASRTASLRRAVPPTASARQAPPCAQACRQFCSVPVLNSQRSSRQKRVHVSPAHQATNPAVDSSSPLASAAEDRAGCRAEKRWSRPSARNRAPGASSCTAACAAGGASGPAVRLSGRSGCASNALPRRRIPALPHAARRSAPHAPCPAAGTPGGT